MYCTCYDEFDMRGTDLNEADPSCLWSSTYFICVLLHDLRGYINKFMGFTGINIDVVTIICWSWISGYVGESVWYNSSIFGITQCKELAICMWFSRLPALVWDWVSSSCFDSLWIGMNRKLGLNQKMLMYPGSPHNSFSLLFVLLLVRWPPCCVSANATVNMGLQVSAFPFPTLI